MASLVLTTAILNLKSLAEEKLFLYLSRGTIAYWRLSLQTLAFIAHLAILACSASGVTPQGICWTSDTVLQWAAGFFYQWQMLSCSVWKAASENACALCATTILGLVQVCELQSWQVLDCDQCAWILLLLFQFCSFSLTSSLSSSLSGLSHLMMGEQGKSFLFPLCFSHWSWKSFVPAAFLGWALHNKGN